MAQSGTTFVIRTNGGGKGTYQGRYMELECHSTQDIANNVTNISWTLRSIGGSSSYYGTKCYVYINGVNVYSIDKGWSYKQFPVAKGETYGSTSVGMKPDGSQDPITVYMDVGVYVDSTDYYGDTWQLDTIPRQPSITGFTVDKVWQNSTQLKFNWSADSTIRYAEYSVDNGATWRGQDVNSNSGEYYFTGLSGNVGYNCKIRLTRSDSGLNSTSWTYWQATYPQPSANIWTENIGGYNGLSQIKVNWSSNINIARVGFSSDNGANYIYFDVNTTSGNYTFTGLNEGQTYNFRISVEASDGHCISVSGTSSRATHSRVRGNLYVNNTLVATNNWQGGVELKNGDTLEIRDIVNGANCSYKLFFENPNDQHQYLSATQTGTTAISMTAEQIRERLQYMTSVNSQDFNVGLTTLDNNGNQALYYEFFGTIRVVNSNPTFTDDRWTYQDTNANTVALTGSNQILVNGFSKLRVSVNTAARGENYADITQYAVSGCTSGSSSTIGNIDCANATNGGTITVTAKDTRNNSTSTTKTATYKDYFAPTMASISATRNNGGVGTITTLAFNGTWWNGNFGASANTLSASYRYKSGSTWSSPTTIALTTSGNDYSFNDTIYGDLAADGFTLGTTFTIEVTITDELNGGRSWQTTLNSGTPAIAISGSNLAIGGQYDTSLGGKLQVNGNIEMKGSLNRTLAGGQTTVPEATIIDVSGSTDGFQLKYAASSADAGVTTLQTTDDDNAEIKIGNNVGGTFKDALSIWNGNAHIGKEGTTYIGVNNGSTNFNINGGTNSNIYWKEEGWGDKINITASLSGNFDDDNKLVIQGASGGAGTDPTPNDLMTISAQKGNVWARGTYSSPVSTASHINGARGIDVLLNGTAAAGYNILSRQKSTNGVFNLGVYGTDYHLYYIDDSLINAGTNAVTKDLMLLNESGDTILARNMILHRGDTIDWGSGQISGSAAYNDLLINTYGGWLYFNVNGSTVARVQAEGLYAGDGKYYYRSAVLYDNSNGEWGTVSLWDSAANYKLIEVYYADRWSNDHRFCAKIYDPNGKGLDLVNVLEENGDMRIDCQNIYFNGTTVTRRWGQVRYLNGNAVYNVLEQAIFMVVGYN